MVRTHPETGRKAIYVNRLMTARIDGLPRDESDAILEELFDHAEKPEFVYAHRWVPGDLVIWDNRCSMHHLTGYNVEKYRRLMHRTTIKGDRPFLTRQ